MFILIALYSPGKTPCVGLIFMSLQHLRFCKWMGNSCVYTALVNKLLKRLERKNPHYRVLTQFCLFLFYNTEVRQRVSLQRPPAVVKQVESFRDDVLQLRSDPSPGVEDQPPVLVVFSYREIKALLPVEYLHALSLSLAPEREELRAQAEKQEIKTARA